MKSAAWLFLALLGWTTAQAVANTENIAPTNAPITSDNVEAPAQDNDSVAPPPFPISRYEPLWEKSPFQLESIAPLTESAGLAQKYALTGIAQVNGEPIVFLLDRASQIRHMVEKKPNKAGLALVRVNMEKKSDDSTAVVSQSGEVGMVKFDAAAATGAATAMGMQSQTPGRHVQSFYAGQNQPPPQPQIPTPGGTGTPAAAPGVAGVSPQGVPTQMPQFPTPQAPGAPTPPGQTPPTAAPNQPSPQQPHQEAQPGRGGSSPRIIRRRALIPAMP